MTARYMAIRTVVVCVFWALVWIAWSLAGAVIMMSLLPIGQAIISALIWALAGMVCLIPIDRVARQHQARKH